jgi:hypothetical protein
VATTTITTGDNIIRLNDDVVGAPTENAGIEVERGASTDATLLWDETNDYWIAGLVGTTSRIILASDNPALGTGATNQVAYWSSSSTVAGDSGLIWNSGSNLLGVNCVPASANLEVQSTGNLCRFIYDSNNYQQISIDSGGSTTWVGNSNTNNGGSFSITAGSQASNNPGFIEITSGSRTSGNGGGGAFTLTAGDGSGTGNGGIINIISGTGGATNGQGGTLDLTAGPGQGSGAGGLLHISAGRGGASGGQAGTLTIEAGPSDTAGTIGGTANFLGGAGSSTGTGSPGGPVNLIGGDGDGNGTVDRAGGAVSILGGGAVRAGISGTVDISSGNPDTTGASGAVTIRTGSGGSTSGNSGTIDVSTGTVTSGTKGTLKLQSNGGFVGVNCTPSSYSLEVEGAACMKLRRDSSNYQQFNLNTVGTLSILGVTNGNGGGGFSVFAANNASTTPGAITLLSGTKTTTNGNGGAFDILTGAGFGSGNGGTLNITSGAGGSSAAGGTINITSGNAGGGNNAGGAITTTSGSGSGSAAGGNIAINGGTGGSTGTGASISLTSGSGGATSGNSGNVSLNVGTVVSGSLGRIALAGTGGNVTVGGGTTASELRFLEPSGSGTNYTAFKAQAQSADVTYTLPNADGSANQFLKTNGSGSLSWAAPSSVVQTLSSNFTDVSNTTTGEDDLMSYSVPGSTLATDGDYLEVTAWGTTDSSGNLRQFRLYFDGTVIVTGGNTVATNQGWSIKATIQRRSSTVAGCYGTIEGYGEATGQNNITVANFTSSRVIKVTVDGGAASDTTQTGMTVRWYSA